LLIISGVFVIPLGSGTSQPPFLLVESPWGSATHSIGRVRRVPKRTLLFYPPDSTPKTDAPKPTPNPKPHVDTDTEPAHADTDTDTTDTDTDTDTTDADTDTDTADTNVTWPSPRPHTATPTHLDRHRQGGQVPDERLAVFGTGSVREAMQNPHPFQKNSVLDKRGR